MSTFINDTNFYKELFSITKQYEHDLKKEASIPMLVLDKMACLNKKKSLDDLKAEYIQIETERKEKQKTLTYLKDLVIKTRTFDHILFAIKNKSSLFYKMNFVEDYITNGENFICQTFHNIYNLKSTDIPQRGIVIDFYNDNIENRNILLSLRLFFDNNNNIDFQHSSILFDTNSLILNGISMFGIVDNKEIIKDTVNRNKRELIFYINQFINLQDLINYTFAFNSITQEAPDFDAEIYTDSFFHNELKHYDSFLKEFKNKKEEFHLLYDLMIKDPCIIQVA